MNYTTASIAHARRSHAQAMGARARATTIEWEELPSLAEMLRRADFGPSERACVPVWNATQPLELWQPQYDVAPAPFREPLNGLHVREIEGPEVFDHFFGAR